MRPDGDSLPGQPELQLPIGVQRVGVDLVVVAVHGDVDLSEAGELRAVLNDACTGPHHTIQVDLDDVRYIGSSGMGVLVEVNHRMTEAGRRLVVLDSSPAIRRAFEIAGVGHVLDG